MKDNQSTREYEIDFAYLETSGWGAHDDLVFGECAGHIDLTQTDANKMRLLADRFDRKPYLSFSTLKNEFSDGEKEWLRALVRDGYRVIALTRQELDPYHLHRRFAGTRHPYAVSLEDLSRNTRVLNVGNEPPQTG